MTTLVEDYDTILAVMIDTCDGLYYAEIATHDKGWVAKFKCHHGSWLAIDAALKADHPKEI